MSDQDPYNLPVQAERETHLFDYLHVVQRRWKIALLVFVLVFSITAIKTVFEIPVYEASAVLRISLKPDTSQQVLGKRKEGYFSLDSEIYLLQSNLIADRAARLLQLEWSLSSEQKSDDLSIRRLIVPE